LTPISHHATAALKRLHDKAQERKNLQYCGIICTRARAVVALARTCLVAGALTTVLSVKEMRDVLCNTRVFILKDVAIS
jgi:hypothetical protein